MARKGPVSLTPDYASIKKDSKDFMSRWYAATSYLRTEVDSKTLKANAIKWLKKNRKFTPEQFKNLESLEDWRYETMGRLCCIMNNGGDVPDTAPAFISRQLEEFFNVYARKQLEKEPTEADLEKGVVPAEKKGIQDYMRDQAGAVASEFDGIIDDFTRDTDDLSKFNPLAMMRTSQLKAGHARHIQKYFTNIRAEVQLAVDRTDEEINESYSLYSKKKLKDMLAAYEKIFSAASVLITSSKTERKPRQKKALDLNKVIAKLKYKKEDSELGIASIRPLEILGAKEIWIYNVKARKIGRYVSNDPAGLGVKGNLITNFSIDKSVQKGLRKPKEQIKDFKKNTAKSLEVSFAAVKTVDIKLNGRLNDDTIILKAFR